LSSDKPHLSRAIFVLLNLLLSKTEPWLLFRLVFSQSLYTLSLIEHFLALVSEATDEEREEHFFGIPGDWCNGINYFRIDGQTNVTSRAAWIKKFNNPKNFK